MPEPKPELTKPISRLNFKAEFKAHLRVITSTHAHLIHVLDVYRRVLRSINMRESRRTRLEGFWECSMQAEGDNNFWSTRWPREVDPAMQRAT